MKKIKYPMRLDKFVAAVTPLSRKEVLYAVRAKQFVINGELIKKADFKIQPGDRVTFQGRILNHPGPRYFMLNKPEGYICANHDELHPTVFELLDEINLDQLHIAGRLDVDTTGLVLITDDGQWNHRVTAPKRECAKHYTVGLRDELSEDCIQRFAQGIQLHGENKACLPATLKPLDCDHASLEIFEGKFHQVKRMFAAVGNRVESLHRDSIGGIVLDEALAEGQYRPLSPSEIAAIGD